MEDLRTLIRTCLGVRILGAVKYEDKWRLSRPSGL